MRGKLAIYLIRLDSNAAIEFAKGIVANVHQTNLVNAIYFVKGDLEESYISNSWDRELSYFFTKDCDYDMADIMLKSLCIDDPVDKETFFSALLRCAEVLSMPANPNF